MTSATAAARTWQDWMHEHVRPRDVLAFLGLPFTLVIGVLAASVPGVDAAVRATGITAAIGALTTIVGYYFGRGEASTLAREAAHARAVAGQVRDLWVEAQGEVLRTKAELEKTVAFVTAQTGVEPQENGSGDAGGGP